MNKSVASQHVLLSLFSFLLVAFPLGPAEGSSVGRGPPAAAVTGVKVIWESRSNMGTCEDIVLSGHDSDVQHAECLAWPSTQPGGLLLKPVCGAQYNQLQFLLLGSGTVSKWPRYFPSQQNRILSSFAETSELTCL